MMAEHDLYCMACETAPVEDIPGWLACYCTSREIKPLGEDDYPESWSDPRPSEPYDTLEEKHL